MRLTYWPSMDLWFVSPFCKPAIRNYFSIQSTPSLNQTAKHQYGPSINQRSVNASLWLHTYNLHKSGIRTLALSFYELPLWSIKLSMDHQFLPRFKTLYISLISSNAYDTHLRYPSTGRQWIYNLIYCLYGCLFIHFFIRLFNFMAKHLSCKKWYKTIKINPKIF